MSSRVYVCRAYPFATIPGIGKFEEGRLTLDTAQEQAAMAKHRWYGLYIFWEDEPPLPEPEPKSTQKDTGVSAEGGEFIPPTVLRGRPADLSDRKLKAILDEVRESLPAHEKSIVNISPKAREALAKDVLMREVPSKTEIARGAKRYLLDVAAEWRVGNFSDSSRREDVQKALKKFFEKIWENGDDVG